MKKDSKNERCTICNSSKIINGIINDGVKRFFYSLYFDIGNSKFLKGHSIALLKIDPSFKCCPDCGHIWTKTEKIWVREFLSRSSKNKRVIKRETNPGIYGNCANCKSQNTISGSFYIILHFRKPFKKRDCTYFDPGNMKIFSFSWKRGVQINGLTYCCEDCGYIFSEISKDELKKFITKHCKGIFANALYE